MLRLNLRGRTYFFVLGVVGAAVGFGTRPDGTVDRTRTFVQQHPRNGATGHQVDVGRGVDGGSASKRMIQRLEMQAELTGTVGASLVEPGADWPEGPCIGRDEQPPRFRDLWKIDIPEQLERLIGYSVLDHCTPIFIVRGGKHSDGDLPSGTGMVLEGLYEKTATGGHIEVNPNALMQTTERYRAAVLGHEELHGILEWVDPARLNQAILPPHVIDKARTQLLETGYYEGADVDDEILPRLLTHDPDGIGLNGVPEEDRVVRGAMQRLFAESQTDPELKRVYSQLQRSHTLTHDLLSGKAGIGALMCGRAQRPSNPQKPATPTSRFRRSIRGAD